VVPVRSSLKKDFPDAISLMELPIQLSWLRIKELELLFTCSGCCFKISLNSDKKFKRATKRGQKVNAELDENCNPIVSLEDDGGDDIDAVMQKVFVSLQKCFKSWSCCCIPCLVQKRSSIFSEHRKAKRKTSGPLESWWKFKEFTPHLDIIGWRLQTLHDMLQIVIDVENFRNSKIVDAAPNENNLTDYAKKPGRRAYKKREVFVS